MGADLLVHDPENLLATGLGSLSPKFLQTLDTNFLNVLLHISLGSVVFTQEDWWDQRVGNQPS